MKPIIGLTLGDPTGIGPEILLKSVSHPLFRRISPIIFGDLAWLDQCQRRLKTKKTPFPVLDFGLLKSKKLLFGRATSWGGYASGFYIQQAVWAAQNGYIDGIVTLPINKEAFKMGGWGKKFPGHTEMLAALTNSKHTALMLAAGRLRAVHVTQHIALDQVSRAITKKKVADILRLTHTQLKRFGFKRPRISVCGLNPHAGDGGLFGREEITKISPAIRAARKSGIDVEGPFPADSMWKDVIRGKYDVGVAMYHDQGQIPLKMSGLPVVNVTLGLPIVRTAPGHGTAYDIAGKGKASIDSFLAAVRMAAQLI